MTLQEHQLSSASHSSQGLKGCWINHDRVVSARGDASGSALTLEAGKSISISTPPDDLPGLVRVTTFSVGFNPALDQVIWVNPRHVVSITTHHAAEAGVYSGLTLTDGSTHMVRGTPPALAGQLSA